MTISTENKPNKGDPRLFWLEHIKSQQEAYNMDPYDSYTVDLTQLYSWTDGKLNPGLEYELRFRWVRVEFCG